MLAFPYLIHQNLPSAAKAVQQVMIKLEVKNKPSIFHHSIKHNYLPIAKLKIPIPILALNTDTDVPPIISDVNVNSMSHRNNTYTILQKHEINSDRINDISPYRSRSVLYVQPKKVNLNEIKET